MLGAVGLSWGWSQQAQLSALRSEQAQVTRWLAQPQVSILALKDTQRQPAGQVLLPSREVLFVLPRPAKGKLYQVRVAPNWKRGDPLTPQKASAGGTFSVPVGHNDYICVSYICVSLEDRPAVRGQTRPAQILGWTKL